MAPLYLEALLLREVRQSLVAGLRILVTEEERTGIPVAFPVVAGCRNAPRPLGVDLPQELQVPLVADGEVITAVAQIEPAVVLITVVRHDESARIFLRKREEPVGDCQRKGDVGHDQIGRTEDDILARTHLGTREGDVEVGVRIITGGVAAMLQIDDTRRVALAHFAAEEAVLLLSIDPFDQALFRLEVEGHRIALVLVLAHREERSALYAVFLRRVGRPRGAHRTAVKVHEDLVARKLHVLIIHLRIAIQKGRSRGRIVDEGVVGRVLHRCIDAVRACPHHAVGTDGIVDGLIMMVDRQLERVHLRGIGNMPAAFLVRSCPLSLQQTVDHNRAGFCFPGFLTLRNRHIDTCHRTDDGKRQKEYNALISHCLNNVQKYSNNAENNYHYAILTFSGNPSILSKTRRPSLEARQKAVNQKHSTTLALISRCIENAVPNGWESCSRQLGM